MTGGIVGRALEIARRDTRAVERKAGNVRRREEFAGPPELARFFRGERLDAIPAKAADRAALLGYLATLFEHDREYAEGEVNVVLARAHNDFATLRRYLIDAGLLERENGRYRRT
jgi:hypothetical protein